MMTNSDTKKIFVSGITGHTGHFFIERLIKEDNKNIYFKCLIRENSDTDRLDNSGLKHEKIIGDLNDKLLEEHMTGCDMVLHIASIYMSKNVIEAAINAKVKSAILVHTTGRFSKYKSSSQEYIEIEDNILKLRDKIEITILRPTMIYGTARDRNMYKLIHFINRHKFFPIFGKGENLMQPVHAKDLGDSYYDVIKNWDKTCNKEYNLSGKYPITYANLIDTVAKHLGKNIMKLYVPIKLSIFAAKCYNAVFKKPLITVEQVMRMMEDKDFTYELAANDFDYNPISFNEGIKGEIEEFKKWDC